MSSLHLLWREIQHRKVNFLLALSAVIAAAGLFVLGPSLVRGYGRQTEALVRKHQADTDTILAAMQAEAQAERAAIRDEADRRLAELYKKTKRITRDLGFNLQIVHEKTDMERMYLDFATHDMPESYVKRLATAEVITKMRHLLPRLYEKIKWRGKDRLLVGFAPEATQPHLGDKPPMGLMVKRGEVKLGYYAGRGLKVGESFEIERRDRAPDAVPDWLLRLVSLPRSAAAGVETFTIAAILPVHGDPKMDLMIGLNLADAQRVLSKPGKISEILALGCHCETLDRVSEIAEQLEQVLPDTRITEFRVRAEARDKQRQAVKKHYDAQIAALDKKHREMQADTLEKRKLLAAVMVQERNQMRKLLAATSSIVMPLVVLVCGVWIGMLCWLNVRERRQEIGALRALGKRTGDIAVLFLGRAVLLGVIGGLLGAVLGWGLGLLLATSVFEIEAALFTPSAMSLLAAVVGAPLVAAMSCYLPTLQAINQDPAIVLMDP